MPTPHLDAVGAFRSPVENSCFMPGAKAPGGARNLAQGTPQEGSGRADPAMQDHPTFAATKKSADFARRKPDKATGGVEDCGGSRIPCCAWDLFWGEAPIDEPPHVPTQVSHAVGHVAPRRLSLGLPYIQGTTACPWFNLYMPQTPQRSRSFRFLSGRSS